MDRRAALALVLVAALMVGLTAVAWLVPTPLGPYRTAVFPDGSREVMLAPGDPLLEDTGLLVREGLHQALRRMGPLAAALALATAGLCAVIDRRTRWLRPLAVLAPLLLAGLIGAVCFTPPDLLTTLIFALAAPAVLVPLGLLALVAVGGLRAEPPG